MRGELHGSILCGSPLQGGELHDGILCGSPLHGRGVARQHPLRFSPKEEKLHDSILCGSPLQGGELRDGILCSSTLREGSCTTASSAVLPAPVGEGSGVGSVLLFHMFAFDYSKSLLQRYELFL